MMHWLRTGLALVMPLALAGCLFLPGKFESTLDIRADRSFTYTYKGEIVALDIEGMDNLGSAMTAGAETQFAEPPAATGDDAQIDLAVPVDPDAPQGGMVETDPPVSPEEAKAEAERKAAERDAKFRELAATLAKEAGYRQVEYRGDGVFYIDYAISGKLTHGFVYPFNQDSAMVFPWVAIELRGKDAVRVKAPGFAKQDNMSSMGMGLGAGASSKKTPPSKMEGTFTLTTNAPIVSQNNEEGAATAGGVSTIRWSVTPNSKEVPTAVLRVSGI